MKFNRWYIPIEKFLKPEQTIVEIGCGKGEFLSYLKEKKFKNLFGFDILNINKEFIKRIDVEKDIIPFKNESVDVVLMVEVIEHLINPYHILREIRRILKKEGVLIISTHNQVNILMRLLFLFGITNPTNDVSRQYDKGPNKHHMYGHLRTYSKKILIKVTAKEGFKKITNASWICLFGIFIRTPSFLTSLLSQHLLYVFKKNDEP